MSVVGLETDLLVGPHRSPWGITFTYWRRMQYGNSLNKISRYERFALRVDDRTQVGRISPQESKDFFKHTLDVG